MRISADDDVKFSCLLGASSAVIMRIPECGIDAVAAAAASVILPG
jgi:hypothetical protein